MIIGVGATDPLSRIADFSAYGRCIDIMAPGVGIYSLSPYEPEIVVDGVRFDEYYRGFWSGTSMAVPVVSGSLALLEAANPGIRADGIKKILFDGAENINSVNPSFVGGLGSGELNIYKSLQDAFSSLREADLVITPVSGNPPGENFKIISGAESANIGNPYPGFAGGSYVATGDIDGDGSDEIITGAGYSGGPQVRIFDDHGNVRGQFFAYGENFRGGVRVAAGNLEVAESRNTDEIITVPGPGGGPHIRVFSSDLRSIDEFFAYEERVRDGLWVAAGDVDADGIEEIVVSPDKGSGPHIRSFELSGKLIDSFYAYDKNFEGGVNIGIMVNR
jgi:hypothetical protein